VHYIRVEWRHDNPDYPVWLISELDDDRWETRKVEIFANGSKGYAEKGEEGGGTFLGLSPVPPSQEIAADPQFVVAEITKEEFEAIWRARHDADKPTTAR
jgi:hypothetical protein